MLSLPNIRNLCHPRHKLKTTNPCTYSYATNYIEQHKLHYYKPKHREVERYLKQQTVHKETVTNQ